MLAIPTPTTDLRLISIRIQLTVWGPIEHRPPQKETNLSCSLREFVSRFLVEVVLQGHNRARESRVCSLV